jgi:hypothetical protein
MKIPGSRIVTEPFPGLEDCLKPGSGQLIDVREETEESLVVGDDGPNLGLLEHGLGDPDPVGILS